MSRTLIGFVVAAVAAAAIPQASKPDFSGLWVMVSPEEGAGNEVLIKQDAATFTSGPPSGQEGPTIVYRLDGTESRNVIVIDGAERLVVGKASWNGNQLTIANTITFRPGEQMAQLLVWSFDEQNRLVLEVRNQGSGEPAKLIYKRKP